MGAARKADVDQANLPENKGDQKGLAWERSCTDALCCLFFSIFIVIMIVIAAIGFKQGDPIKILTPFDSVGNRCGAINQGVDLKSSPTGVLNVTDFTDYPIKLFYPSKKFYSLPAVCVKACPKKGETPECMVNDAMTSCQPFIFDTVKKFQYCLPESDDAKAMLKDIYESMNSSFNFGKYLTDLQICWPGLVVMCFVTLFIAIIYIFLLKWITKPLLYASMVIILAFFILMGGFCFIKRGDYDPELEKDNYDYALIGAIVSWVLAGIYLCFILCCWKNISLGASIMEAASAFVSQNLRILFLPLLSWLVAFAFMMIWIFAAVHLYSVGEPEFRQNRPIANIKWDDSIRYAMWVFLFGLFWIVAFIICLQQFMIAAMTCMWYFGGQGEEMSDVPGEVSMLKAMSWGMWYHQGSIAFGSFIIAVVTMIRVVFEYFAKQYEMANKENPVVKAVICCIRCILFCLDKYVKFITKNAFIQIAVGNKSFCMACWTSFFLIIRWAGRFGSAAIIGWIMMLLGKGTIMASSAYFTFLVVQYGFPEVQQPFLPAILIACFGYLVGSLFLSIFSFSCTAILHCFLLDEESGGDGKNTPPSLKNFLDANDEKNAKTDEDKKEEKESKGDDKGDKGDDDANGVE